MSLAKFPTPHPTSNTFDPYGISTNIVEYDHQVPSGKAKVSCL
jgi:hypothetical protein